MAEEERLEGLTFNAYRRISEYLIVSGGPANPGRTEMIPITESELVTLVAQDAAAAPGRRVIPMLVPR